jgi:hypothetical protein
MSYKTERLLDLFPHAFAATERDSLLHKILDALGAEMMAADEKVKRLLKSHWVEYAEADALDRLGAIFGVARRMLRSGALESDSAFRLRLMATVPLFTGGGTVEAVRGAVRSALGLPFNLDQLNLPAGFEALRDDIDALVTLQEFSPKGDRVLDSTVTDVALDARSQVAELTLSVAAGSVAESLPQIEWTFDVGIGRRISVLRMDSGQGFRSLDGFVAAPGKTIVFSAGVNNRLSAVVDGTERADQFVNLDGTAPALMPPVPASPSQWRFRAQAGLYDQTAFDGGASFDLPRFHIAVSRVVFEPLTFDVEVPYFIQDAVAELQQRHGYKGEIFAFEGIPLDRIQEVVDQTRAGGVRGSVQFYLKFFDDHAAGERFAGELYSRFAEDAAASEDLLVANTNDQDESHDMAERLTLAGVFDISKFEGPFAFM